MARLQELNAGKAAVQAGASVSPVFWAERAANTVYKRATRSQRQAAEIAFATAARNKAAAKRAADAKRRRKKKAR